MSKALAKLARTRLDGLKPSIVFVTLADASESRQWPDSAPDIVVQPRPEALRMDWRPLVGCNVVLIADERTELLRLLTEKFCALAASVLVSVIGEMPAAGMFLWSKDLGWRAV